MHNKIKCEDLEDNFDTFSKENSKYVPSSFKPNP